MIEAVSRTIIAGSRGITSMEHLDDALFMFLSHRIKTVLSGGAAGVDNLGEQWARREGKGLEIYPAEWGRLGICAGFVRNVTMAELADALLAIWDGHSRGTWHMIQTAVNRGLKVMIWDAAHRQVVQPPAKVQKADQYSFQW